MRGLNAPPRISRAPAASTPSAAAAICGGVSTEHGPAMTCTALPPIGMPATSTIVFALCHSRATILYCLTMCIEFSTPGMGSNISGSSLRSSPTAPISVRSVPRDTCTSSPCGADLGLDRGDLGVAGFGLHDDDHLASPRGEKNRAACWAARSLLNSCCRTIGERGPRGLSRNKKTYAYTGNAAVLPMAGGSDTVACRTRFMSPSLARLAIGCATAGLTRLHVIAPPQRDLPLDRLGDIGAQ